MKTPLHLKRHHGATIVASITTCLYHLYPVPALAAAPFECPAMIDQKSLHIASPPAGWAPYVDAPLYLHAAAPMSGPPEQLGELADFRQQRGKGYWTHTYRLNGPFPQGKWLVCMYGESNQIKLSTKLPDTVQSCSFKFRQGKYAGQNDIAIDCR